MTGEGTSDVMERTLGDHKGGDEITGDDKSFSAAESNTIDGTTQTVVIRRPFASDGTYDFTDLLTSCSVDSIDAISAQGETYTFEYHDSRAIGTLERVCDCTKSGSPTSSPEEGPEDSSSANSIFDVMMIAFVLVLSLYFL